MFTKSRGSTTSSLTSALHNTRVGLLLSPFGSFSPGRLQRISSVPLSDVFLASRSNTRMRLSTSAGSHGHKLELRNQLFSERRTKTHKFGTWSVLLFFFVCFTSESVQSSLNVTAQKEELGCHGDQEAARRSVLIPKQTLQCGVINFDNRQHLCHPASLRAHADTHTGFHQLCGCLWEHLQRI